MKNTAKKILCAGLAFMLVIPVYAGNISTQGEMLSDEAHVYEILPGTDEWVEMTPMERYASCAVSEEEVSSMTTRALVETVLNYPYLINIYAFDSIEMGIKHVSGYFPGLDELFSRQDAVSELERFAERRIQTASSEGDVDLSLFDAQILTDHLQTSETLAERRASTSYVYTPEGNPVEVTVGMTWSNHKEGLTPSVANEQCERFLKMYPSASLVRGPNPSYNCHSYAWYSTSSTNNAWMDDPSMYMEDGSYERTTAAVGCNVAYKRTDGECFHSGKIVATTGGPVTVRSKWGPLGLFTHAINDCPYVDPNNPDYEGSITSCWVRS